jgi:lipopolysaccharide export system protein LptA
MPVWALPDDRQQAIEINADEAVINEQANAATYKGSVDVRQGTFQLLADQLDIAIDAEGAVSRM